MENKLFGDSATPSADSPTTDCFNYEVRLRPGWWKKIDWDIFRSWAENRGILNDDWSFKNNGLFDQLPRIAFRHEIDALAFILRFEL